MSKFNNQLVASGVIRGTKDVRDPDTNKVTGEVPSVKNYKVLGGQIWSGFNLAVAEEEEVTNPRTGSTWNPFVANFKVKTTDEAVALKMIALEKKPVTLEGYIRVENVTPKETKANFVQFFYVNNVVEEATEVF